MAERSVTYAGHTYALDPPFVVLATQNPVEQSGTYALPEAQLDRFLLHITIHYPQAEDERAILARTTGAPSAPVTSVMTAQDVIALQRLTREVVISDALLDAVTALVRATRPGAPGTSDTVNASVEWGAGPRAGQAIILSAKARALLHGRFAVTREDLAALALPALRHRVLLNFEADARGQSITDIVQPLVQTHLSSSAS
jgi:MoxR-like ATPase